MAAAAPSSMQMNQHGGAGNHEGGATQDQQAMDRAVPANVHILLVDDERLSRVVVANLLRKCNYKVTVAESGGQAMEMLQQQTPGTFQLLLTDVMMPQVDGIDLLRYVRSHRELGDLPVVMMSASEQAETVCQCIRGGAEEYLVKPVTQKEVQKIWTHVIKRTSASGAANGTLPLPALLQQVVDGTPQQHASPATSSTPGMQDASAADTNQAQPTTMVLNPPQQVAGAPQNSTRLQPTPLHLLQAPQALPPSLARLVTVERVRGQNGGAHAQAAKSQRTAAKAQEQAANGVVHSWNLRAWLNRPARRAQQAECLWVFAEVLLLLDKAHTANSNQSCKQLRPSQLILHSTGAVTWAAQSTGTGNDHSSTRGMTAVHSSSHVSSDGHAHANGGAAAVSDDPHPKEAEAYCSPEEILGEQTSPASDVFRAGLLLLELLYVIKGSEPQGAAWQSLMSAARSRNLPSTLVQAKPTESALLLTMLNPDPSNRPTITSLLQCDLLTRTMSAVRARHATASAAAAAPAASVPDATPKKLTPPPALGVASTPSHPDLSAALLGDFLGIMHSRKRAELSIVESSLTALDQDIAVLEAALEASMEGQRVAQRRRLGLSRIHSFNLGSGGVATGPLGSPCATRGASNPLSPNGHSALQTTPSLGHAIAANANAGEVSSGGTGGVLGAGVRKGVMVATVDMDAAGRFGQDRWHRMAPNHEKLQELYLSRRTNSLASAVFYGDPTGQANLSSPIAAPAMVAGGNINSSGNINMQREPAGAGQPAGTSPIPTTPAGGPSLLSPAVSVGGSVPVAVPGYMTSFADDLCSFSRYRRLKLMSSMQHGDTLSSSNMVCCIAFDRDDEYFATAGVSKRIRLYDLQRVLRAGGVAGGYPVLELSSRSRLSSVCWSGYVKSQLAAADYEGVVALWDVNTNIELIQFEEHAKRVWAVDTCRQDPTRLASASDDGTVRVWAINQENSTACIQCPANVCSVQWNPESSHLLSFGAANCWAAVYDLRQASAPLYAITGHQKAVSYVRHMSGTQLLTASTDNTIRRWDLPALTARLAGESDDESAPMSGGPVSTLDRTGRAFNMSLDTRPPRTSSGGVVPSMEVAPATRACGGSKPNEPVCSMVYKGHVNERNFVGLSVSADGYVASGSEDNSVVCYHASLPIPALTHSFSSDPLESTHLAGLRPHLRGGGGAITGGQGAGSRDQVATSSGPAAFVSSVCWAQNSGMMLAANSLGVIRVLQLD